MAAVTPSTLRVASWNLHEGLPADEDGTSPSPDTSHEVAALLRDNGVDLVGFQELDLDTNGESVTLRRVVEQTALRHTVVQRLSESSFFSGRFAGVALASRYPLTDVTRHLLPNPQLSVGSGGKVLRSHDKGLLAATVQAPGASFNAVSVHTLPFHFFRREADDHAFSGMWSALATSLQSLTGLPLVVCGDFNTEKRDLILAAESLHLDASMTGHKTYRDLGLDDILHSPHFTLACVEALANFSDHRLCVAEFTWNEK